MQVQVTCKDFALIAEVCGKRRVSKGVCSIYSVCSCSRRVFMFVLFIVVRVWVNTRSSLYILGAFNNIHPSEPVHHEIQNCMAYKVISSIFKWIVRYTIILILNYFKTMQNSKVKCIDLVHDSQQTLNKGWHMHIERFA